jgi:serine/threonine protein kinase
MDIEEMDFEELFAEVEEIGAGSDEATWPQLTNYRIVRELGEGGFGVVYAAEQLRPVRRAVAVKVIKPGMDTRGVIAHFASERQALAVMDHPGIARVFDAGVTGAGRAFFAMELVAGMPLIEYCDGKKLGLRERIEIFIQICHALQHAHQKGIIHRDLKPGNVLVADPDGTPLPKVIDFGIAKAADGQRLGEQTIFTAFEPFIGTPAYMSPEQADFGGTDIDTRSDIYSLGVMLYELLTGRPPFENLSHAGLDETRRRIREEIPARPSALVAALPLDQQSSVAKNRGTDPARVIRGLRGDLDWVTMKALEKDRARRYASAAGFAADLRRCLDAEPVGMVPAPEIRGTQQDGGHLSGGDHACHHRGGHRQRSRGGSGPQGRAAGADRGQQSPADRRVPRGRLRHHHSRGGSRPRYHIAARRPRHRRCEDQRPALRRPGNKGQFPEDHRLDLFQNRPG